MKREQLLRLHVRGAEGVIKLDLIESRASGGRVARSTKLARRSAGCTCLSLTLSVKTQQNTHAYMHTRSAPEEKTLCY